MKKKLLFLISCAIILMGFNPPQKTGYLEQALHNRKRSIILNQITRELQHGTNHGTAFLGRILDGLEQTFSSDDEIIAELRAIGREDFTAFDSWCEKHNLNIPPIESFRQEGEVLPPSKIVDRLTYIHKRCQYDIGRYEEVEEFLEGSGTPFAAKLLEELVRLIQNNIDQCYADDPYLQRSLFEAHKRGYYSWYRAIIQQEGWKKYV